MPRRSKVELSPETIAELEEQFYNFLHSLSPEETNKFFKEFLTTEEKMMMYKRLALYWSLFEGYSLASIQRMLGITHDTTRIYNKRKNEMSAEFKSLLHRIGRDGNGEPMKEDVIEEKEEMQDEPVVVEETITVVEEIVTQEPQEEEQETTEEKVEAEPIQTEDAHDEQKEERETKSDDEEDKTEEIIEAQEEESEDKNEENKEEENPEKKKKGFGRFFGF